MSETVALMPISAFTNWLAFGERGISSEAIVSRLTGVPVGPSRWSSNWPHDPDDFRRCQRLLNSVPLARLMFPAMRDESPQWARLVDAWDEIHATSEAEVPGCLTGANGNATNAYRLMRRVIAGGVECAACEGSGNGVPCEKCKGTGRRGGGRCRAIGCNWGHATCSDCDGRGFTGGADS